MHALEKPAWIWHDRIAYVLLQPARACLGNQVQRGSWSQINHQYPKDETAREVFSLWIDHGTGPKNARYAYMVVPGIDRSSAGAYAARKPVRILRNAATLQAVWHEKLRIAAAALYEAGSVEIRRDLIVAVDTPCLVLLRESPDKLTISVSNPENKKATVRVDVSGRLRGEGVQVLDEEGRSRILVDLPDGMKAGSSVTRTLRRD